MDLIRREDAVQAVKAYLDLCCLTEAKFHKGLEDYNDEIAREIISVIVEQNSSEKPNNCEPKTENPCDGCVCDDGKHLMYCMNCKGIAWKTEPPKVEDEPQTETSTLSEKVQLTDEPQTSGVVWTEDAIKNEPKSYTTWASTDEPQTDVYDYKGNGKWERSE